jgi:hypothetical protein
MVGFKVLVLTRDLNLRPMETGDSVLLVLGRLRRCSLTDGFHLCPASSTALVGSTSEDCSVACMTAH